MRALVILTLLLAGCAGPPGPGGESDPEAPTESAPPVVLEWPAPGNQARPGDNVGNAMARTLPGGEGGGICTVNFLFSDGTDLFFGTAAHCMTTQEVGARYKVAMEWPEITGLEVRLAYSSWLANDFDAEAFQAQCNRNATVSLSQQRLCWNDFALLHIDRGNWSQVHPALRARGATGAEVVAPAAGNAVWTVGDSYYRANTEDRMDARSGVVLDVNKWRALVHFGVPSTPGDSGSPVTDAEGQPLGVVVYLHTAPATSNGVARLDALLAAAADEGFDVQVVGHGLA